jgi:predicted secreted protein
MKQTLRALSVLLLLSAAPLLLADDREVIFDEVGLSASAEQEVDNDRARAVLFAEREGIDPADLAKIVNRDVEWALRQLEGVVGIDVSTPSYQTIPIYNKGHIDGWRVRQTLRLESSDYVAMSEVLGRLQKRLGLQGMSFYLSDAGRQDAEDALIPEALKRFKARADMVVRQMGRKAYRLVAVSVDNDGASPIRPRVLTARMEAAAAPPLEAGTSKVRITVSGSIQLRD